jgi:capsular polysaccharide biosynthesis protein
VSPQTEATIVDVESALLTPLERGPLRVSAGQVPGRWIRGAVHDADGRLVPSSQRMWPGDPNNPVAADPIQVPLPAQSARLEGTWLYAGHWAHHFGHFMVESLPNLWPTSPAVVGVVGHRWYRPPKFAWREKRARRWRNQFVRLAGYGGLPVHQVGDQPVLVHRLLVPTRPVVLKGWALPEAGALWQRVGRASGAPGTDRRVFLSRTRWHAAQKDTAHMRSCTLEQDVLMDQAFASARFTVVHPELLTIQEALQLVRGADVLAGAAGSALHLSAFARPETRVIEIGDSRSPQETTPTQQLIDAVYNRLTAFIPFDARDHLQGALAELGVAGT